MDRAAPRASMTADQMKILYGSATPGLAINSLACPHHADAAVDQPHLREHHIQT
jgi:hypothetical protein